MATQLSEQVNSGFDFPAIYVGHVMNRTTDTRKAVTHRVYNKNKHLAEKRNALTAWGNLLQITDNKPPNSLMLLQAA